MMSEKITFQELIDSIADKTDNSKKFTHDFLKDFADVINSGLEKDGKVNIAGLGKFGLRRLDEREGYNPQTGESMTIPAHNKIIFKPYKDLRERVNAPYVDMEPEIIDEESDTVPAESNDEQDQQMFIPTAPPPFVEDEKSGSENLSNEENENSFFTNPPETTSSTFSFDDKTNENNEDSADSYQNDVVEYKHGQDTFDEDLEAFIGGDTPGKEEDEYIPPANDEEFHEEEPAPMERDPAAFSSLESDQTKETEAEYLKEPEPEPQPDFSRKDDRYNKSGNKSIVMAAAVIILLLIAGSGYVLIQSQQGSNGGPEQASTAATAIIDQKQDNEADQQAQQQDAAKQPTQADRQDQQTSEQRSVDLEISQGQTLWSMAENRYNNPYLWPWIYDANKSSIDDPDLIIAGEKLTIPLPSGSQNSLTAGDSLEVAVGYVETYKWYKDKGMDNAKLYLWVAANYDEDILNRTDFEIDKDDLAFANRSQVQ